MGRVFTFVVVLACAGLYTGMYVMGNWESVRPLIVIFLQGGCQLCLVQLEAYVCRHIGNGSSVKVHSIVPLFGG